MLDVWTYWEGPRPAYIDVCLESVASVCAVPGVNFHCLSPETIGEYLPAGYLESNYRELPQIALRADCIRAALLARYGGWWWDADTVGIKSPIALMKRHAGAEALYMTWTNPPRRILNGYIYLSPGSLVAKAWLDEINRVLRENPGGAEWCSLGEKVLSPLLDSKSGATEIDRRIFLPIDIDSHVAWFFEPGNFEIHMTNETVGYGLNHSWFMYHKGQEMMRPMEEWPQSRLVIHRLLWDATFTMEGQS